MQEEGDKVQAANSADREEVKKIEEQKSLVQKVLQKIKVALSVKGVDGKEVELNPMDIDNYIEEIETCKNKLNGHNEDLLALEEKLERRKAAWQQHMFKCGEKDALVDDIERSVKDNDKLLEELN